MEFVFRCSPSTSGIFSAGGSVGSVSPESFTPRQSPQQSHQCLQNNKEKEDFSFSQHQGRGKKSGPESDFNIRNSDNLPTVSSDEKKVKEKHENGRLLRSSSRVRDMSSLVPWSSKLSKERSRRNDKKKTSVTPESLSDQHVFD